MAIFASFVHGLPNILHTWPHDSFHMIRLSMTLGIFQGHCTVLLQISKKNGVWYGKSYYRQLIGNHTLAFDWCHFWWPWSSFEGHFSLGCHFSNPWHAFASQGLPAIAELLVTSMKTTRPTVRYCSRKTNTNLLWTPKGVGNGCNSWLFQLLRALTLYQSLSAIFYL